MPPSDATSEAAPTTGAIRVDALRRNRLWRIGGYALGIVLFYAPFAVIARLVGMAFPGTPPANEISWVHSACLRMPIGWLAQPWMWGTFGTNPLYVLPLVILPLSALAASPLFCGWLCPAGALPEYLSRLVPRRFQYDIHGKVDIVPVRYGFFTAFMIAPFVTASVCCSLCNFTYMQNIVDVFYGNLSGWIYLSTTGLLTLVVWLVPLGLLTVGGRGWCMFLCPVGSSLSLVSGVTSRVGFLPRVRHDSASCAACGKCEDSCTIRAIDRAEGSDLKIHQLLCNGCMDCTRSCPNNSLYYGRKRA